MQTGDKTLSPTGNPIAPGNKHARVTDLPKDKFEYVHEALRRGASTFDLARKIQEEWGLYNDVRRRTLAKSLERYRESEITDMKVLEITDPYVAAKVRKRIDKHVNVLDEFSDMIRIQRSRINMALEREEKTKIPLGMTEDAVRTMGVLLKNYGELAVKVGIVSRMLGEDDGAPRFEPKNLDEALKNEFLRKELVGVVDTILEEIDETTGHLNALTDK